MIKSTTYLHLSILVITLLVFAHLSKSEATSSFHGVESLDGRRLFRKLGYDLSKMEQYDNYRRSVLTGTDQITPGGPDSQHHKKSPSMS
ncbi:hypothetical protein SSX86_003958 [Deinandra increscens subsp. villosa]|uniref:CLAVATA3/ESR (CLE)-related protein 5 n=1 Tax=Deinandra increscens subsp. villosa TaxID=3103831 RepID=A0AAP0DN36_9ASTR